jgi:hypothetical protein
MLVKATAKLVPAAKWNNLTLVQDCVMQGADVNAQTTVNTFSKNCHKCTRCFDGYNTSQDDLVSLYSLHHFPPSFSFNHPPSIPV